MVIPRTHGTHDAGRDELAEPPFEYGDQMRLTHGMAVERWEDCVDGRRAKENAQRRERRRAVAKE